MSTIGTALALQSQSLGLLDCFATFDGGTRCRVIPASGTLYDTGMFENYRINNGDTLSRIAKRFRTTVDHLKYLNASKISNVDQIRAGNTILVPR